MGELENEEIVEIGGWVVVNQMWLGLVDHQSRATMFPLLDLKFSFLHEQSGRKEMNSQFEGTIEIEFD